MNPYQHILNMLGETSDQSNLAHWIKLIAVAGNLNPAAAWTYPTTKPVREFLHRLETAVGPNDPAFQAIAKALSSAKERE